MNKKRFAQNRPKISRENMKQSEKIREKENPVTMTFKIPPSLRNDFKAKVIGQGRTVKNVFIEFMQQYIKN